MQKHKGNVVIIILLIIVVVIIVGLMNYKMKLDKKTLNEPSKIEQMDQRIEAHIAADNQNAIILAHDEVLNPFISNDGAQTIQLPKTEKPPITPTQSTGTPLQKKEIGATNVTNLQPNGLPIPLETTLLDYPAKFNNGDLAIQIDNTQGKSNILVYLYHLRPLNTDSTTNTPTLATGAYVTVGSTLTFDHVQSGVYQIKWVVLSSNTAYQNTPFRVFRDNKYAYDRVLIFKDTDPKTDKVQKISITALNLSR